MTEKTEPNLGLKYGYDTGEAGWGAGYSAAHLLLGAIVHLAVISSALSAPPGSPANGDRYVVAASPTGAWSGHAGHVAVWRTEGAAWSFYPPNLGWRAWDAAAGAYRRYDGSAWVAEAGGGAEAFTDLSDAPASYTGQAGKALRVNAGATALEFYAPTAYASESYVDSAVAAIVDSSPGTLNTLNELAAALGDDANFAATTAASLGALDTRLDALEAAPAASFTGIAETPDSFTGQSLKAVRVNAGETALEFYTPSGGSPSTPMTLTALTGAAAQILADGPDTNHNLDLRGKGSGTVMLGAQRANYLAVQSSAAGGYVRLVATGSDTNIGICLVPKAGGAITAANPDAGVAGGNARGTNAIDFQISRNAATQVASGVGATLSGGVQNTAGGSYAAVSGGTGNSAGGTDAAVGGGQNNTASAQHAAVAGGYNNIASGFGSAVGGGEGSTADGGYSWAPGGYGANTRGISGRGAAANGMKNNVRGDSQIGWWPMRRDSTGATRAVLTTDGAAPGTANQLVLPNTGLFKLRGMVITSQWGGSAGTAGDCASFEFIALVKRRTTLTLVGLSALVGNVWTTYAAGAAIPPDFSDAAAAAWRLDLTLDGTNFAAALGITCEANKNCSSMARIDSVEIVG